MITVLYVILLLVIPSVTAVWARQAFFQQLNETLAERIVVHPNWFPSRRTDAAWDFLMNLLDSRLSWFYEQALLEPIPPSVEYMRIEYWLGRIIKLLHKQEHLLLWPSRYELALARREAVIATQWILAGNRHMPFNCFTRAQVLLHNVNPRLDQYHTVTRELAMIYWVHVWHLGLDEQGTHVPRWPLSLVVSQPDWCRMFDLLAKLQGPAGVRYQRTRLPAPYQNFADIWLNEH